MSILHHYTKYNMDNTDFEEDDQIILAIVGGRDYSNYNRFNTIVKEYIKNDLNGTLPNKIISGGAKGVDTMAEKWSKYNNIDIEIYKPDWSKEGKKAGLMRNTDIINRSTHVLALPTINSKGTYDSIHKAQKQYKPVKIVHI